MNARLRRALALAALLLANLLLDVGLVHYVLQHAPALPGASAAFVHRAFPPICLVQVLLVASWLALGGGKWYWRLLAAIPPTICVALSEGMALAITPTAWAPREGTLIDHIFKRGAMYTCWFLAILLTVFAALLPLRRLGQLRLTREPLAEQPALPQFSAADVFVWLVPIGGVLAVVRLLLSFGKEEIGPNPQFLVLDPLRIAPLVAAAALAAFASRRRIAWLVLVGLTLLVAGGSAIAEYYRLTKFMPSMATMPASFLTLHKARMFWQPLEVLFSYFAAMLVGLLSCLALRALGWRLQGPAGKAHLDHGPLRNRYNA